MKTTVKPRLITHRIVARLCGIDTSMLRDCVARGTFPEPHSILGERTWLYRADYVEHYIETTRWPEGAKFKELR